VFDNFDSILITGGSGSLGTTIIKYLLNNDLGKEISLVSRNEKAQYILKKKIEDGFGPESLSRIHFVLGDVRDSEKIDFLASKVDLVLHAAALKHINMGEEQPAEFVKTNVIGTQNIVNSCLKHESRMIFISTDKACMPINMYGMTKALAERIVTNAGFICVRYGNVAASNGSVIPYFFNLIKQNKVLPITDSRMTRFFLTLDDAVDLIFKANQICGQGEVLIKQSPSIRIVDLAKYIGKKFGNRDDYPIKYIGLQNFGEKLHEMLIAPHETQRTTEVDKYYKINSNLDKCDNHIDRPYTSERTADAPDVVLEELFSRIGEIVY
jgi:UDP-N-acetylglucosamine 4,6-dehydratase/5-epimerase